MTSEIFGDSSAFFINLASPPQGANPKALASRPEYQKFPRVPDVLRYAHKNARCFDIAP
jgi:hypothetical protein